MQIYAFFSLKFISVSMPCMLTQYSPFLPPLPTSSQTSMHANMLNFTNMPCKHLHTHQHDIQVLMCRCIHTSFLPIHQFSLTSSTPSPSLSLSLPLQLACSQSSLPGQNPHCSYPKWYPRRLPWPQVGPPWPGRGFGALAAREAPHFMHPPTTSSKPRETCNIFYIVYLYSMLEQYMYIFYIYVYLCPMHAKYAFT